MSHHNGAPPDSTPPAHFRHLEERLTIAEDRIGFNFMTTNAQVGEIARILLRVEEKLTMIARMIEQQNER